ncbi:MAG: molybdenum ABC transporter ATP-binding protein [Flavobacteriaceae bacterium]
MRAGDDHIRARFAGSIGAFTLDMAFEAPMRGVTAIYGPSGCGKTTLLRCMAGLRRLSGSLRIGPQTWQDDDGGVFVRPHRREVGYVFQEPSLFPHLSVGRNLTYGARRSRAGGQGLDFDEIVGLLGIGHLLERGPHTLSGGERQRVAVGRALLSKPRILLMDEPLAALDRGLKEEILPYFEALHETLAIPVIYVSHDIAEVGRLADRMIVVDAGRKVAEGALTEVLERVDLHPSTGRFEAGVVLTARVVSHDRDLQMTRLDHHGQAIVMPMAELPAGSEVRLRIRARDVVLATERPRGISIRNVLSGTVREVAEEAETAFAETLVDIGGAGVRARVTRAAVADLGLRPGMPVHVLIKSVAFDRRAVLQVQKPHEPPQRG